MTFKFLTYTSMYSTPKETIRFVLGGLLKMSTDWDSGGWKSRPGLLGYYSFHAGFDIQSNLDVKITFWSK